VIYGVDILMGLIKMFGAFCLVWWIMKGPIYDCEQFVELVMQASELMEVF